MGLFRDNETNIQMESNMVKNPNWLEANQLAILQMWSRIWTRDHREQIQLAKLELGASELLVQRSNRSATLLPGALPLGRPWEYNWCTEPAVFAEVIPLRTTKQCSCNSDWLIVLWFDWRRMDDKIFQLFAVTSLVNREFKIPRRRRRQKHRLKSDSSIYETLVRLSQLGHYVLCKQTLPELNS